METDLVVLADAGALAAEATRRVVAAAQQAVAARGRFSLVLAGGSTPKALYRLLATACLPWPQTSLFWGDERCVPPGHGESNYRLAHETLLAHVPVPPGQVHRMRGEWEPRQAAQAYDRLLRELFRGPRPDFDLALLGMGADGHTASLFPGSAALVEDTRLALAVAADYGGRPAQRVTLTLPALNAARQVLFLVSGADKADAVRAVWVDEDSRLPARRVRPVAGRLTWLLDQAAAAGLG
ncbi:MAG: 6-phosphogluconolactonase [Chloroflexi bacterium]|nr:6-phosphogluconolactonase [Chloroflexota bacterium]